MRRSGWKTTGRGGRVTQATCLVTYPVAGSHSIAAIYSGAEYYQGSTSHSVTETVN
jgi:hypothetical protein